MADLVFVTTEHCELCRKAERKINFLRLFFSIKYVDVQSEYKEYLLRVPVLLKKDKVLEEGIFSRIVILKNLIF
tara:strand:+ start:333 stop:554 length:222 start_codon:yes stop_codon:yes gene_type:complete